MNYIWDVVIRAHQSGLPKEKIVFTLAKSYSPYMELAPANLNFNQVDDLQIEINPYYRFYEIFKDMFNINNEEDVELRNVLLDITIHFLDGIDRMQGMNKTEFYHQFIRREILDGRLGPQIREKFVLFSEPEQTILVANYLQLLVSGEMLYLLKETIRKIFKNSTIYANYETVNELMFFIPAEKTDLRVTKLELIKDLFLPLKFTTLTYWKDHFGIIGNDETMLIDSIALY